ncbi:MAG TPA: hypothetical protein VFP87_12800, partial [Chitinophagaceae bacterium]|nr:hypothetical protein [Chitinophagaceae bacterium]
MKGFITPVALPATQAADCAFVGFTRNRKLSLSLFLLLFSFGFSQLLEGQIIKSRLNTPIINSGIPTGSCDGLFTITTNKTYDPVTNQTTYTWTITRTGTKYALSHWGFPIDVCPGSDVTVQQFLSSIVAAQTSNDCINYRTANTSYQTDKSQDCTGDTPVYKFDEDMGERTTQC